MNTAVGAATLLANIADGNTATGAGALLSNIQWLSRTRPMESTALFSNTTGSLQYGQSVVLTPFFSNIRWRLQHGHTVARRAHVSNNTAGHLPNNTAVGNTAMVRSTNQHHRQQQHGIGLSCWRVSSRLVPTMFICHRQLCGCMTWIIATWIGNIYGVSTAERNDRASHCVC